MVSFGRHFVQWICNFTIALPNFHETENSRQLRKERAILEKAADLCSKRILGRSFSHSHDTELMRSALRQATSFRQASGMAHHSDRGSQCTSELYRVWRKHHGIARSMDRVGNSYDNAPAESVIATIKRELPVTDQLVRWREARDALHDYIDRFYNCARLHLSLDHLSSIEHEGRLLSEAARDLANVTSSAK